jgi:L-iditol 2-dehydrogenase
MDLNGTMEAWVKQKGVHGLVKTRLPIPKIQPDEVLVRVKAGGICGSDVGIYKGYRDVPDGLVPGHEFCGDIVQVGDKVQDYQVGDMVTPGIIINCGECFPCRNGYEQQCENLLEYGIHVNGCFAEYVACKKSTLHRLPKDFSPVIGASIEPVAVACNIVGQIQGNCLNKNALVFGPGPIGLYTVQLLKMMGFANVIMVGTRESRLKVARDLGCQTINIREEDLLERCQTLLDGEKADVIIEATGQTDVFEQVFKLLVPRGQIVFAGIFHEPATVDFFPVIRSQYRISFAFCYTWSEYQQAVGLVVNGSIKFEGIVTHVVPMDEADKGFELSIGRQAIKVILENTK